MDFGLGHLTAAFKIRALIYDKLIGGDIPYKFTFFFQIDFIFSRHITLDSPHIGDVDGLNIALDETSLTNNQMTRRKKLALELSCDVEYAFGVQNSFKFHSILKI